jgi:AraC family transcriptional regulator, positive regulator of tynA and feaB
MSAMPISVSTDPVHPAERKAFWTEAICRSFANIETRPLGSTSVSGHFEFVEIGRAKLVRFDSSPQCYSRDARLVSRAGSDEFMFDLQRHGRSSLVQAANEGSIRPGFGVLYDARRPFEDRLDGPGQRSEVLIVTVPAASLLRAYPDAGRLCAKPVPLSGAVARAIAAFVRSAIELPDAARGCDETDVVEYLAALLRLASSPKHHLSRTSLFRLIDAYLRANMATSHPAPAIAGEFNVSERSFHRVFADRGTTFERHLRHLRVEQFRKLLGETSLSGPSIASLATACGFADAAHATRTFKSMFGLTPRDFRAGNTPARESV